MTTDLRHGRRAALAAAAGLLATPALAQPVAGGAAPDPAKQSDSFQRAYDLGREVSVTRNAPGSIKRLSVAVLLRDPDKGRRTAMEINQVTDLEKSAVGFDPSRQDQVTVISRKFAGADDAAKNGPAWYDNNWLPVLARNLTAIVVARCDRASASGGAKSVSVTGAPGIPDSLWFAGTTRDVKVLNGVGGAIVSDTVTTPWASAVTANDGTTAARMTGTADTLATQPVSTGGNRTVDTATSFDATTGLPTQVSVTPSDVNGTCTQTTYAPLMEV